MFNEGLGTVWIAHSGGGCPLSAGEKFDALHRDGIVTTSRTAQARERWDHYGAPCDIVAYRVAHNAKVSGAAEKGRKSMPRVSARIG